MPCKHPDRKVKLPSFNIPGVKIGVYCAKHKEHGMVNVISKTCKHQNCAVHPSFNIPGLKTGVYCAKHREPGMVNVKSKTCKHPDCAVQASCNLPGLKIGIYCAEHREPGMVNVINKFCKHQNCTKQPVFNMPGLKIRVYCAEHREPGMVDVKSKSCKHPYCTTHPVFNAPGMKIGLYCASHRGPGMVNVISKTCKHPGCTTQPAFNLPGVKSRVYCAEHREPGMVDVNTKKCTFENCTTHTMYGLPGVSPSHCAKHKQPNQIKTPTARCKTANCTDIALYGAEKALRCEIHRTTKDRNLIERRCKSCNLTTILDAEEFCWCCKPSIANRVRANHEEERVMYFLDQNFKDRYIRDRRLNDDGGCVKQRPDFFFQTETHNVILEVDEHQHRSSSYQCDIGRMFLITQSSFRSTIFIRYNPHNYRLEGKRQIVPTAERHLWLKTAIEQCLAAPPTESLEVLYLFYDEFDIRGKMPFRTAIPFE